MADTHGQACLSTQLAICYKELPAYSADAAQQADII